MIVTIDNLAGAGPVDYTGALCPEQPLKIERRLNAPSRCTGLLDLGGDPGAGTPLPMPARRGRIVISSHADALLFTGYLATEPVSLYAGAGLAGPVYRIAFAAISDEWLLDKQTLTLTADGLAADSGALLDTLTVRVGAGALSTTNVTAGNRLGVFEPAPAAAWSQNAGALASAGYAAYRVLGGALSLQTIGTATHTLNFDNGTGGGTLQAAALKTAMVKELANDVTVTGAIEPAAYVTEVFAGDGTTTVFELSGAPFHPARPTLLTDSFNAGILNPQLWSVADPGSHLTLGPGGLTLTGGNGFDGQTCLTALDAFELGGTLVIEAGNVQLAGASAGVLCGLYSGPTASANCFAGYNVRQSAGNTVATPFVNGAEVGTTYTLLAGHTYTLRLRLHSVEAQRVGQTYYTRVDGVIESFGGALVASPMALVFDVVDLGNASNTPATVLYDGSVASSPASATFVAVNSVQLFGTLGFIRVQQTGSAWVVSTLPSGATQTRLIGVAGEGVDATFAAAGKLTFFAGRVPIAGERVAVQYRTRQRAVARLEDAASIAAEAADGVPGTARWLGKVLKPVARSSADCECAAQAVLSFAASRSAAIAGSYSTVNPEADLWPGDVLNLTANGQTLNVVARTVDVEDGNAVPEILNYKVAFANDWAESLGLTVSEAVATDALLPVTALSAPAAVLANLQQLALTAATTTSLQIDTGTAPPAGGGFEVRLRDDDFGAGVDQNLVLRSPVRSFAIPRTAQVERYFLRMYDASTPPLYSRFSSAVFTNLPIA